MNRTCLLLALALALTPAVAATPDSTVEVKFVNLEKFTDLRTGRLSSLREREALAGMLRKHLQDAAPKSIPAGTRLAVTITDVDMAGEFRPIASAPHDDLRVVRDSFPPRIELDFRLTGADGSVQREGTRSLRDSSFLVSTSIFDRDLLSYEKHLLDDWLRREFAAPR